MATTLSPKNSAQKNHPKLWTKKGLGRLGFLIRQARQKAGWSMDQLVRTVAHKTGEQISKKTVGNIENNVGMPQYNSLAAIAALRFVKDSRTGKPLDEHDFIDIASETYPIAPMLAEMIGCAILTNKVTEGEIWRKLETMRQQKLTEFTLNRLEKIQQRQIAPTDDDIRVIRELIDPNGEAFDEHEWLEAAGLL